MMEELSENFKDFFTIIRDKVTCSILSGMRCKNYVNLLEF